MGWAWLHDGVALKRRMVAASLPLLALAMVRPASSQEIELSGYYENTFQADYTAETKALLLDASKIRLDLGSLLTPNLEVRGNVNFIVSLGSISRELGPYLPDAISRQLQAVGAPDTFSLDRARLWLDNAYVTLTTAAVRVRAGMQQLSWGPGYSFNPTDLFHRKNILDPTYEKEGVVALRADYRWGVGGELSAIVARHDDLSSLGYALRLGTHVSAIGYDVALTAHQVNDTTSLDPATFMPVKQRRRAFGAELSGEILGLGVWVEGNYNVMERESNFARIVAGLDYTLGDGTYLMAEGLYNGRANGSAPYPLLDWLANVISGEPVSRWWILAGARRDLSQLVLGSMYLFASPDGSVMLNPRLDVSVTQNADVVLFGGFTLGDGDGSFPPGLYSLIARGTVYFRVL